MVIFWQESSATNNAASDTFKLANEAYSKGAIDDAIQLYQAIADNGYKSLALYYNLGSAYANQENWGEARYYLEKARLENPLDPKVKKNLEKVKAAIEDPYLYPRYPLFPTIELIHAKAGRNVISIIFLILFLLFLCGIHLKHIRQLPGVRLVPVFIGGLLFIVGIMLFFEQTYERFHNRMVIVNQDSALFRVPDINGAVGLELKPGHKLRIQEHLGPWFRVDLADGTEGWIPRDQVKTLKKG